MWRVFALINTPINKINNFIILFIMYIIKYLFISLLVYVVFVLLDLSSLYRWEIRFTWLVFFNFNPINS